MERKQSATGLSAGLERAARAGAELPAISRTPAGPGGNAAYPPEPGPEAPDHAGSPCR